MRINVYGETGWGKGCWLCTELAPFFLFLSFSVHVMSALLRACLCLSSEPGTLYGQKGRGMGRGRQVWVREGQHNLGPLYTRTHLSNPSSLYNPYRFPDLGCIMKYEA